MRIFLFILLGFVFGMGAASAQDEVPFDASTLGVDGDVIAFVGKKVFVRDDETFPPEQDENSDDIIIYMDSYMDSRYEARYKIIDLVAGEYEGETIDFHAYDHYGTPRFSKVENILMFVNDGPESRVHSKYNYYDIHRTTDGDWAACGDAYVQNDPEEVGNREPLEPISFLDPVTVKVTSLKLTMDEFFDDDEVVTDTERAEAQAEINEDFKEISGLYQPPIWKRDGDTATCQLGTRVRDLYEFQNQTRFLPETRAEMCETRHATELEVLENWEAKNRLIDECISLLEIQNLPNVAAPSKAQSR